MNKIQNGKIDKYPHGEENTINTKLVVALQRSIQLDGKSLAKQLSPYGLTIPQFGVLEVIYHSGPLNISQVIEKTLSSSGNMTVVVRNLVKRGLVTKNRDPEDGRAFLVHLTEEGQRLISEIFPKHLVDLKSDFSNLGYEEKQVLLTLLKKLNGYVEKTE